MIWWCRSPCNSNVSQPQEFTLYPNTTYRSRYRRTFDLWQAANDKSKVGISQTTAGVSARISRAEDVGVPEIMTASALEGREAYDKKGCFFTSFVWNHIRFISNATEMLPLEKHRLHVLLPDEMLILKNDSLLQKDFLNIVVWPTVEINLRFYQNIGIWISHSIVDVWLYFQCRCFLFRRGNA